MGLWKSLRRGSRKGHIPSRRFLVNYDHVLGAEIAEAKNIQIKFQRNGIKTAKYSIFNFLPRNLFEQFRRIANFYFLIVGVVQLGIDSPVSPFTSIAPLVFVVAVTMLKQGYEDYLRHKADSVINNRKVTRIKAGQLETIKSKEIQVGDLLRLEDNEDFPCDLVLLSSSNAQGKCYVMTANLDGETNLKTKKPAHITNQLFVNERLNDQSLLIDCDHPCVQLESFHGNLYVHEQKRGSSSESTVETLSMGSTIPDQFDGNTIPIPLKPIESSCVLTFENLLLRGSTLKNTDSIVGVATFTGEDTKMSLNGKMTSNKFSTVEKKMNRYLIFFLLLLVGEVVLAVVLKYTVAMDNPNVEVVPWYLGGHPIHTSVKQLAQDILSFLVLFNYIIPISLYVTMEMQRFFGSLFFVWDLNFYDEDQQQGAICNSSDLNEDLGQVDILFSDKTGTLTENIMTFHSCSIGGIVRQFKSRLHWDVTGNSQTRTFFEALSLCHTVEITHHHGIYSYNASSPDEKALVEACKELGITFTEEAFDATTNETILNMMWSSHESDEIRKYKRLHVLEFDSDRKRMSVIVRKPEGTIWVLCKGADSSLLSICTSGPFEETAEQVNDFAMEGLRTLLVGVRELSEQDLEAFATALRSSQKAVKDLEQLKSEAFNLVESDLTLLGAVAIEDQLQPDVKTTLTALRKAGIRIWVLTGDKKETAVNISYSSGHFFPNCEIIDVSGQDEATLANALEAGMTKRKADLSGSFCLLVDGATLHHILPDMTFVAQFRDLAKLCTAVLCCRMSPLQKADVVKMMKQDDSCPVTAAVGDGANDVSMLQEAHVGLGITGREGRAATRASDFALTRFRHLERVFLVHGYWYYHRVCILVQYSFYKNVVAFTPQLFMAFFNSYSTESLYDSLSLTVYNIIYTSVPIFVFSLLEQHKSELDLLQHPDTYHAFSGNRLLRLDQGAKWFGESLLQSIVCFFFIYGVWTVGLEDGHYHGLGRASFGQTVYQTSVFLVSLRMLMESKFWNGYFIGTLLLSVLVYFLVTVMTQLMVYPSFISGLFLDQPITNPPSAMPLNWDYYKVIVHIGSALNVWLTLLILCAITLVPILVKGAFGKREFFRNLDLGTRTAFDNKGFEMS
ncbi:hypothetical protein TCAL_01615, partial [Tigriopus californicus]|eukprot:TCALIF_01615-PA protein Name:"Similar to ATP11B Probable phospholipid-transporting ATPase IF (Homo sapiens)" AED:0.03 eAED:0.03 QI:83/1/0.5/1/0.66/0.75/4/0/1127